MNEHTSSATTLRARPPLALGALLLCALVAGCGPDEEKKTPAADMATPVDMTTPGDMNPPDMTTPTDMNPADMNPADMNPVDMNPPPDMSPPDMGEQARVVIVPLGETIFLRGDDYLAFWGVTGDGAMHGITLAEKPAGATAEVVGDGRLTPDVTGEWVLKRGEETVRVQVRDDYLNEDTFLNFNYTPAQPLLLDGDDDLWVASPPSNAVHLVKSAASGVTASKLVPTGSWPTALARWGEYVLVTQAGRDSLGFVNRTTQRVEDAVRVGDEPVNLIVDGDVAYVALMSEGRVAKVDLTTRAVVGTVEVGRKPRAMSFDPTTRTLYVASLLSSNAHPQGLLQQQPIPEADQHDVAIIDADTFTRTGWVNEVGTILRGAMVDGDRLIVALSHSRNDQAGVDAESRPHEHGLAIIDLAAGSAMRHTVTQQVNLDLQQSSTGPAASPFSMVRTTARTGEDELIVTLSAGAAILVLDPITFAEKARLTTGNDPRGLVFDDGRMITYSWLDNRLDVFAADGTRSTVEVGRDPTPADVKEGQRIFNDATFSKFGAFSCNNCHIDGTTDGLVWNILLDGDVNTLAFRNVGGTGPFLWGGFLPTLFDFSREVLRLVGARASGDQMEKLTIYMQSVTAPPNPYTLPGGKLTEAGVRGEALFNGKAGCGGCHAAPLFTSGQMAEPGKTNKPTDIPSLIATYDSGPWGRESQWTTLDAMVQYAAEYTQSTLTPEELADLSAYVHQIPGDILYLNAASPLNHSENVWSGVDTKLSFSSALAPGQEGLFTFEVQDAGGQWATLPGAWAVKGRVAYFTPDQPLQNSTSYRMRVDAGLRGVFGRATRAETVVDFATGEEPGMDVSGEWDVQMTGAVSGGGKVAFIQARGGKVTGTLIERNGDINFDHLQGYVVGDTIYIHPFQADTPFGQIPVQGITAQLIDDDMDGYADRGNGTLMSIVNLDTTFTRISLPGN